MKFRSNSICRSLFALLILLPLGCKNINSQVAIDRIQSPVTTFQEQLLIPEDPSDTAFDGLRRKASVVKFYQRNGPNTVWIRNGRYSVLADSMIYMLRHVQYYGFPRGSYHLPALERLGSNGTPDGLIRKEILLTDAFLSLSQDLRSGIQNSQTDTGDSLQIELLNSVLTKGSIIRSLESQEPVFKGYVSLKEGLRLVIDSLKEANVDSLSIHENIRLISINLERWRAEKENIGARCILINIPSFHLDVIGNDSVVLSSKVIVGTPEKQTPILSSTIECFSTYPYWHVPRKISVEEYLPVIKNDPTFISRNNFDVLDRKGNILNPDSVPWSSFHENYFPVALRQREGSENSLGIIKFIFDNPYAVFLHDTNAKRLFNRKTRAFSHGCIRMERAVELAHFLVTGVPGRESTYVSKYLKERTQHWVNLKNPIPIHVRYFTCEFKNNVFLKYNDVYGKDRELYPLLWDKEECSSVIGIN